MEMTLIVQKWWPAGVGDDIAGPLVPGCTMTGDERSSLLSTPAADSLGPGLYHGPELEVPYDPGPDLCGVRAAGPVLVPFSSMGSNHARY